MAVDQRVSPVPILAVVPGVVSNIQKKKGEINVKKDKKSKKVPYPGIFAGYTAMARSSRHTAHGR
jgi:hypothetical protein